MARISELENGFKLVVTGFQPMAKKSTLNFLFGQPSSNHSWPLASVVLGESVKR